MKFNKTSHWYSRVLAVIVGTAHGQTQSRSAHPWKRRSYPGPALPAFAAFPNGYSNCKALTTQHAMVSGPNDLTKYPLTVILTDGDLRTIGNGGLVNNVNGYDIGFYPVCSASGTALKWEMESYAPTTGAIVAHVLRPMLSRTINDTIGMYYGGGFSSFQSTVSAVRNASYKGVYHLGPSLSLVDSTSNGFNIVTNAGRVTAGSGQIAGSAVFNGTSSQGLLTNSNLYPSSTFTSTGMTLSAWVNRAGALTNTSDAIALVLTLKGGYDLLVDKTTNYPIGGINGSGSGAQFTTALAAGQWYYLTMTADSAGHVKVYVNGIAGSTATQSYWLPFDSTTRTTATGNHPSAFACPVTSVFAVRETANLGTDMSVPRRRLCAAWTLGSVPGLEPGARTTDWSAPSHSLFNPAPPEAGLITGTGV